MFLPDPQLLRKISVRQLTFIGPISTLTIVSYPVGMKPNMSAIINWKEKIGSSCLFLQKTHFYQVDVRKLKSNFQLQHHLISLQILFFYRVTT